MSRIGGIRACVFDAYGTLFDFASAVSRHPDVPEDKRQALITIWRDKQMQYTWLRSVEHRHADFEQVTAEALDVALETTGLADPKRREALLTLYRTVSPFPEVKEMLEALRDRSMKTAILSNGTPAMLEAAVGAAGLDRLFDHVLSVEAAGVFKPAPEVYQLAPERLGLPVEAICFVSSNGWDAYCASAFGFKVTWCNRHHQPAERLPGQPDAVIDTLSALPDLLLH